MNRLEQMKEHWDLSAHGSWTKKENNQVYQRLDELSRIPHQWMTLAFAQMKIIPPQCTVFENDIIATIITIYTLIQYNERTYFHPSKLYLISLRAIFILIKIRQIYILFGKHSGTNVL
mmetsp:Transcript_30818/g.46676  ORF Transcript_30818/g.46676 Transcript_30818/m.46676 type:complete len:118 (-) Transcript_30818:909-1262(-)